MISRNSKCLTPNSFPTLSNKVILLADFFDPETGELLKKHELEQIYDVQLTPETYIELRYIISISKRQIGITDNVRILCPRPSQPLLIGILNCVKKGCNTYYRLLRKNENMKTSLAERENKWHLELNDTFNVQTWNQI